MAGGYGRDGMFLVGDGWGLGPRPFRLDRIFVTDSQNFTATTGKRFMNQFSLTPELGKTSYNLIMTGDSACHGPSGSLTHLKPPNHEPDRCSPFVRTLWAHEFPCPV